MLRYLVVTALALVALNHPALAKDASRARCPGGRFMAADAPLVTGDTAPESGAVVIAGGQVTVGGSCAATAVAAKRTHAGTLVRARWASCSGLTGPVRLRALIRPGCATIVGVIRARHHHRRFLATRQPECGNDIREGHEQCDGGACCTDNCEAVAGDASCPGNQTCTTNDDCANSSAAGAFCARRPGHCDGAGVCTSKEVVCTANEDPVCGCDGKTYSNACEAMQHGVNVARPGSCDAHECGTIVGIACDDGRACELPPGECHGADLAGRCVDVPDVCLGILDPVCGCDGNTYVNDCYRLQAKVQKAHDGHCHCLDVMCSPGTKPVDTDGDGCPDRCVAECDGACDCLRNGELPPPIPCPIACTTNGPCGAFWVCEDHHCLERCGPIPPDTCQPPPSCRSNDDCSRDSAAGAFCAAPPGQCDGPGTCEPRPEACPEIFMPVCGCDGSTYGNACDAAAHGARIAHNGRCECAPPPCAAIFKVIDTDGDGCLDTCVRPCQQTCDCYKDPAGFAEQCPLACPDCGEFFTCEEGACREHCGRIPPNNDQCQVPGFCTTNDQCAAGEYCACGLGMCDGPGICVDRPDVCTREAAPVCGCDGHSYPNPCVAAAAGVRVAASGACECHDVECPDGSKGVDTDGDGCTDRCRKPCKDACDCGPLPLTNHVDICPLAALCPAPFCGNFWACDDGFCTDRCGVVPQGMDVCPRPDGCASNDDCSDHQFCFKLPGGCDARGKCQTRPDVCPDHREPVCGCDWKTYGNSCEALASSTSVAKRGACPAQPPCTANGVCPGDPSTK